MYIPKHFSETDDQALHHIMHAYPLATLISLSPAGVQANRLPLHFTKNEGMPGTLRGHVARANPLWKECPPDSEVLAIFHGPNAYISPSWYPTKAKTGMVVSTWNYVVVHAHGKLKVIEDALWLRKHLDQLTAQHEAGSGQPWQLADAPADFTEKLIKAVVGIEIEIVRLTGKSKVSQNQPRENQTGVIQGLRQRGTERDQAMVSVIESTLGL